MRNTQPLEEETRAANMYYADRHSVRSKASTRSKRSVGYTRGGNQASSRSRRSNRDRDREREGGRDLPWVQITPSTSGGEAHLRHYP
jgi:hypothetical protein